MNQGKTALEVPLSLSYFIGLGYDTKDLEAMQVTNFYLTTKGYILASFLDCPVCWPMPLMFIVKNDYNCPFE